MMCQCGKGGMPNVIRLSPLEEVRFEHARQPFLYLEDAVLTDFKRDGVLQRFETKSKQVGELFNFKAPIRELRYEQIEKKVLVNTTANCFIYYLDDRCFALPFFGLTHFSLFNGHVIALTDIDGVSTLLISRKEKYFNLVPVHTFRTKQEFMYTVDSNSLEDLFFIDDNKILRLCLASKKVLESYPSKRRLNSIFFDHRTSEIYCTKPQEYTLTIYSSNPIKNKFNWRLNDTSPISAIVTEIGQTAIVSILCVSQMNLTVLLANAKTRVVMYNLIVGSADPFARLDFLDYNLIISTRDRLFNFSSIKENLTGNKTLELGTFAKRSVQVFLPERYQSVSSDIKKLSESSLIRLEQFEQLLTSESPSILCFKCFSKPRKIRFQPCGHILLCNTCFDAPNVNRDQCYFCRTEIKSAKSINILK